MLATTPRTGSTLLARALWDTGRVGAPKEYLNPTALRDWEVRLGTPLSRLRHRVLPASLSPVIGRLPTWTPDRVDAQLARIAAHRAGPTGQVGLKVHAHHAAALLPEDAPRLRHARWIRLRREDRLGQALSWARARQTGRWAAHRDGRPPVYRRGAIDRALSRIETGEAFWEQRLAGHDVLELTYEALTAEPLATVNRVLDWLGEDPVDAVSLPLARQADATSDAWRARYLAGR